MMKVLVCLALALLSVSALSPDKQQHLRSGDSAGVQITMCNALEDASADPNASGTKPAHTANAGSEPNKRCQFHGE